MTRDLHLVLPAEPPDRLEASLAHLHIDQETPKPLVIGGDTHAWSRLAAGASTFTRALAECPVATVAIVTGKRPAEAERLLAGFDLVASGSTETTRGATDAWWRAFSRAPQACSALAGLVRQAPGSLIAESLTYSALQAGREYAAWLSTRGGIRARDPGPRVRLDDDGSGLVLTLTRPLLHNALDALMREELCDALDAVAAVPGRPVLLRGLGPSFCSGGDRSEFGTVPDPMTGHYIRTGRSVARRLAAIADRTTCLVHGHCIGAGLELAALCHRVVATRDSALRLPEVSMGLIPGAGGTVSLPARIGRQRFLDLAITGRTVGPGVALGLGLVDELIDEPRALDWPGVGR